MEIQVGELIKKAKVSRCGNGDYPVLSMTMHDGLMFQNDRFKKQIASVDQSNYQVVKRHQLVESFPIDEGVLAVQELTEEGIVSPAYKIWDVNMDRVIPVYLELALRSPRSIEYYKSKLRGTTARRRSITDAEFCAMQIKLPGLKEQERIIELITRARALSVKRQQELDTLDELIKARFVELFGTPYGNEKGFPMKTVADVIEFTGGSQPDKKYFEYEPSEDNIRLIQIRDYKTDNYITYIPKSMAKRFCDADDIMIGRYGPPIFQILKGIEGSYNVALMKATPKMGNKEFVRHFLMQDCLFDYLDGLSQRTAGQSGIEMPALKAYPFPYPPIELQNQFEKFVKQVDKSKVVA